MEKEVRSRGAFERGVVVVCLLFAILGGILGYWEMRRASRHVQEELLRTARLLSESVNPRRLQALSGSASDLYLPDYSRLNEQLLSVLPVLPRGSSISILGRREDGALVYLMDVRAAASALPGDEFRVRSSDFQYPFDERRPLLLGPFAHDDGSFFAALVPLVEPVTRRVIAVFLLETDARNWRREPYRAALVPWGATILLLMVLFLGYRFSPRLRDSRVFVYAEVLWVASMSLLLAGSCAWLVGAYEFRGRTRAFSMLSDFGSSALIQSLQELRDCSIEGLGRFFESSQLVDAEEFAGFARHLIAIPHVDEVLWAPAVPSLAAESGDLSEAGLLSSGDLTEGPSMPSSSSYALSFPVLYSVSADRRILPPGTDLRSIPSLKHAIELSVRNGMKTASEAATSDVGSDGACRSVLFRPVRSAGGDLMGVVGVVLNLEVLLNDTMLRDEGAQQHVMDVELKRLLPGGEERLLLSMPSGADALPRERNAESFHSLRPFFVFGRAFVLETRSGEGFASMHPERMGKIVLFFGIAVSALITLLAGLFLNWRRTLLRFVTIKTVSLAQSEFRSRKLAHLYRSITEGVVITDAEGLIEECNDALEELTGFALEEMQGRSLAIFSAREGQYDHEFLRSLGQNGVWQGEVWNRKRDGEVYPVWLTIAAVQDDSGQTTHYSGVMRHIGGIKSEQERLNRMAYYDFLTGLPNRALFTDRLEVAMARAKREGSMVALVFLDLDRFKEVNDAFGHEAGDALLIAVADRLSGAFREQDTVARLAGDEFVLLFEGLRSDGELDPLHERLEALFQEPFTADGRSISMEASFGVAFFPEDGADVRSLLDIADGKMYAEKTARRKRRGAASGSDEEENGRSGTFDGNAEEEG